MNVAIIPARGGSKRIPRKNIKEFCGKPMIAWPIEVARASKLFGRIVVSTDDEEIASVAREWGAETPFIRPPELSDDYSGTNAVVKHALEWLLKAGHPVTRACCIYATAPFITIRHLREGFDRLESTAKDFAFSVTSFPFPIQRALRIRSDGSIEPLSRDGILARSQDLEEAFHDAGQFYWGRVSAFLDSKDLFSPASVPVLLPRHLVQDIDTPEDWLRAEYLFKVLQISGESSS